jgi:hypothetical protein
MQAFIFYNKFFRLTMGQFSFGFQFLNPNRSSCSFLRLIFFWPGQRNGSQSLSNFSVGKNYLL